MLKNCEKFNYENSGREKNVEFVDLVKRFAQLRNEYLVAKIGFDTAENGLLQVWDRKTGVQLAKLNE